MELNCTHRAVIYLRYSSHSQRDVSIEQQLRACRQFAERQGIDIVKIYEDRALTGTNDRRPGFQQMIADSAHGGFDYVIVYSLDRFARDRYDSAVYKRQLKTYGIKVLSAMEQISDDPTGILMESLLEGLAEYYSKELSQKIRRGMADNASRCLVNGPLPLGYVRSADGHYQVDDAEAATVLEAFRRVSSGEALISIIRDFNARGLRTKRGQPWNRSSFSKLLSNCHYIGTYRHSGVEIPGGVPAIVPQDLFDIVQAKLVTKSRPRSTGPQRRRRENGTYLLTGKLFCGDCKSPMVGISGTGKHGDMHFYYTCKGKRSGNGCHKRNLVRDQIEERIARLLREKMLTPAAIEALADAAVEYQLQQSSTSDIDALKQRLKEIDKSLDNIMAAIEAGILTATTKQRLLDLEEEKRTTAQLLAAASADAADILTREQIIAALELFQSGDIRDKEYQESLIDTFLVSAYVYDDRLRVIFSLGPNTTTTTDIPIDLSEVCISDPQLHQSSLYELTQIIIISGLFVFEAPTIRTPA